MVSPAATLIDFFTVPESDSSTRLWVPAAMLSITTGVMPRISPSTITRAPGGVDVTLTNPLAFPDGHFTFCVVWTPAVISTGIVRVDPWPRISMTWRPAASSSLSGALPRGRPSTRTSTPSTLACTISVPSAGGRMNQ